ncbi:hypothetical protein PG999_010629 [Apiospora kogelbergensis]|uniref:BZIP domain-containing protein n=1 Tax=Apiospora kogelbergensis TaxID=1337665 RepID=A0AAW0QAP7_9PEZI
MESREAPRSSTEARTAGGGKKRALTQARREQNRAAQKLYRERQRKLREGAQSRQRDNAAKGVLLVELRPKKDISTASRSVAATSPSVTYREERGRGGDKSAWDETAPEQQEQQEVQPGPNAIGGDSSVLAQATLSCLGIDLPLGDPLQGDSTPDFTIPQDSLFGNDACAASMLYDDNPSLFDTDFTWEQPSPPWEESSVALASDPIIIVPSSSSSSNSRSAPAALPTSPPSVAPSQGSSFSSSSYPSSFFFADPYANARSLSQTAIFSALLHNALALGFNLAALADCTNPYACLSPFYRATATAQDDPRQLVADALACIVRRRDVEKAVTASANKVDDAAVVPASLRPTLAQILVPHHASLDLIPFPQFRDRVIMLSAALPHQFNLLELKKDIYAFGALRVATTAASVAGGCIVGSKLSCQPWEPQCWEARGWFLRKWSLAIDHGSNEIGQAYI